MSYDPACEELAEQFLADVPSARSEDTAKLAQAIQDAIEGFIDAIESLEPCSSAARAAGCTCRMENVHSASIDPPEVIVDGWCPLHGGRDPDEERERLIEDREERRRQLIEDDF